MKNLLFLLATLCLSGCHSEPKSPTVPLPDTTLAKSIADTDLHFLSKLDGRYNDVILSNERLTSGLSLKAISDTEVSLDCKIDGWGEIIFGDYGGFSFSIPRITVSGKPYDVKLREAATNGTIAYYSEENSKQEALPVEVAVTGWIKVHGEVVSMLVTRRVYECEIDIVCRWRNEANKEQCLDIKIMEIDHSSPIMYD